MVSECCSGQASDGLRLQCLLKRAAVGLFFLVLTVVTAAAVSCACVAFPVATVPLGVIGTTLGACFRYKAVQRIHGCI